jgi:hypothetical protein
MYKGKSRFQQAMTSKGRRLSGYPKSRKLAAGQGPMSSEGQFEAGTAYVKQISPLINQFMQAGLTDAKIAEQLRQKDIGTPSGSAWTETLATELVQTIRLSSSKYAKRVRRAGKSQ